MVAAAVFRELIYFVLFPFEPLLTKLWYHCNGHPLRRVTSTS